MKECPICHTVYDDNLNFCVKDGHELIDKPMGFQQTSQFHSGGTEQPTVKLKKRSCLKKIIISVVVVIICLFALYRCMMNATTYLRTEPYQIVAPKCGGKAAVAIDYDGYIWFINHKPDWVSVDEHDKDFDLSFNPNTSGSIRQGTITIQSGNKLAQVELSQNANATFIKPSVSVLKFEKSGGHKTVKVETDGVKWIVEYPKFLDVETSGDSFTVEASTNGGDYRQGIITITEDNVRTSIPFQQAGKCPNCHGQGNITCPLCGGAGGSGYGFYYVKCSFCNNGIRYCDFCGGSGEKE